MHYHVMAGGLDLTPARNITFDHSIDAIDAYLNLVCSVYQDRIEPGFRLKAQPQIEKAIEEYEDFAMTIAVGGLKFVITDCKGCVNPHLN